jgi:hypothetical protein
MNLRRVSALLLIGAAALGGCGGASDDQDAAAHEITLTQFKTLAVGTPRADVIRTLGEPEPPSAPRPKGSLGAPDVPPCIFYKEEGFDVVSGFSFQLCFKDDKLASKHKQ